MARKLLRATLGMLLAAMAVCLLSTGASAQEEFLYGVSYFSNAHTAGAPDGTTRVVNPGTLGTATDVCASTYIFNYDEQLSACCSCRVTPNGELELSTNALTRNPGNGVPVNHGAIKIVATLPNPATGKCDATQGSGATVFGLDAWQTHVQRLSAGSTAANFALTETAFTNSYGTSTTATTEAAIEAAELSDLQEDCSEVVELDSGNGQCQANAVSARGAVAGTPGCTQ
jgi:hypothetical protein